jgi:hypothetical protein
VEASCVPVLERAVAAGALRTLDGQGTWIVPDPSAPPGTAGCLRVIASGHCVFHHHDEQAGAGCAAHAALGHGALPASCQHFPRICLSDGRGVHVTLSHYCPTAAGLLFDHDGPVAIVEGPDAVPGREVPEGLDAREALPPALTSRVLMDLEGYDAWERHMIETLAGDHARGRSAQEAIALLAGDARSLAGWRPGAGTLAAAVAALGAGTADLSGWPPALDLFEAARAACAPPWTWPERPDDVEAVDARLVAPAWPSFDGVVRRYLAAHAFAAWGAYQSRTMAAVVMALARAHAVLRVEAARCVRASGARLTRPDMIEAVRRADLLLRHYADPSRLA